MSRCLELFPEVLYVQRRIYLYRTAFSPRIYRSGDIPCICREDYLLKIFPDCWIYLWVICCIFWRHLLPSMGWGFSYPRFLYLFQSRLICACLSWRGLWHDIHREAFRYSLSKLRVSSSGTIAWTSLFNRLYSSFSSFASMPLVPVVSPILNAYFPLRIILSRDSTSFCSVFTILASRQAFELFFLCLCKSHFCPLYIFCSWHTYFTFVLGFIEIFISIVFIEVICMLKTAFKVLAVLLLVGLLFGAIDVAVPSAIT